MKKNANEIKHKIKIVKTKWCYNGSSVFDKRNNPTKGLKHELGVIVRWSISYSPIKIKSSDF